MKRCITLLLATLALLALGCRAHFGPGPNASASFAMSTYTHQETTELTICTVDGELALLPTEEGGDVFVCEQTTWYTDMARPWGTSSNEYYIDTEQEAGSVQGDGMSTNLSNTIGQGVVTEAIDAAADAFIPTRVLGDVAEALTGSEATGEVVEVLAEEGLEGVD